MNRHLQDDDNELVAVEDCRCIQATAKAILIVHGDGDDVWIPQSQIHDDSEVYKPNTDGTLIIPRWLAEDKELSYCEYHA